MHEIAIAETICKVIEREAGSRGIEKLSKARLKVGVMNAFDKSNLELSLTKYKDDPAMSGIKFEIEEVPVELECDSCKKRFTDGRFKDHEFAHRIAHAPITYLPPPCPSCGAEKSTIVSGEEITLVSIE